jgi:autotransporter-associated beta strand protein/T5SS/PEP-CTERM-associated repeat protein
MKFRSNLFKNVSSLTISSSICVVCMFSAGQALATVWNGTGTVPTDWNEDANWEGGNGTGGSPATINISSPIATISSDIVATPTDILVGNGEGASGRLDHLAGIAKTGNSNWVKIGQNGGTGVYNLADTAASGGHFTGYGLGSGSLTVSAGQLRVGGGDAGSGSSGTLNVNTSGTVSGARQILVGTQGSTGVLNMDSGTIQFGEAGHDSWLIVGDGATGGSEVTGTLNMSGGTLTKIGNQHIRIGASGAKGYFNLTGGVVTNNAEFQIGNGTGTQGEFTMSGGTLNTGSYISVGRAGGTGTLSISGGTINKSGNGASFIVGDQTTGTVIQSGGTIKTDGCEVWIGSAVSNGVYEMSGGRLEVGNWFVVGRNGGSDGTINMSGGTIYKSGGGDLVVGADNSTANGKILQSGGQIHIAAGATHIGKGGGTGTLTLSETAEFQSGHMVIAATNPSSHGTVNLDGGVLKTLSLKGGPGESILNFNGGVVQANDSSADFISGIVTAEILAGGGTIDTQGFELTSSQIWGGTGPLTKVGSGTLHLTGDSTHSGLTRVTEGKLVLSTRSSLDSGHLVVADGATLGVTRRDSEGVINANSLTLGTTAAPVTLEFNMGDFGNPMMEGGTLNVLGDLKINGTATLNITNTFPEVGSFPLIRFGSRSGAGTLTLGALPPGVVAHLDTTRDSNAIYLVVTQSKLLEWDDSELTGGIWDTNNLNWNDVLTYRASQFVTGAPVSFYDFGTVDRSYPPNPNVVIAEGGVIPGAVTFLNSEIDYHISGAGGIHGTTGVLKQGSATVTMSALNSYTGVTRVEGGVFSVETISNAGSPSGIGASDVDPSNLVLAGGTLRYTGSGDVSDRGFSLASHSVLDVRGDLTLSGPITAIGGSFTKIGDGNLTLANPGVNALGAGGTLRLDAGVLTLNGSGTQSSGGLVDLYMGNSSGATSDLVLIAAELNCSNYLAMARGSSTVGAVSTCTLTDSVMTTGNLSLGYDNARAGYSATSILTLNNSTYTTGYSKIAESNGATAIVRLNGTSTMTAENTDVGQNAGSSGTLEIHGNSTYTSNNRLQVGRSDGSVGTVLVENSGNFAVKSYVSVGFGGEGHLTLKDNATFSTTDDFSVNENSPTPSTLTLQGEAAITVANSVYVGRNAGRTGTVTQSGGILTNHGTIFEIGLSGTGSWLQSGGITHASGTVSIGRNAGSLGVLTVSGTGVFNQVDATQPLRVGTEGNGTLTIRDAAVVSANGAAGVILSGPGGPGTVNLEGGTLVAKMLSDGGTGTSTLRLNGGTLKAGNGANWEFIKGLNVATVEAGGAFIDSNGESIAISQGLTGSGSLTKRGAGVLLLNAAQTYAGSTVVEAGALGGEGSIAGPLNVTAAGTIAPGNDGVGTFRAGDTTLAGTFACEVDGATADVLVAGALNLSGARLTVDAISPLEGSVVIATSTSGIVGNFASIPAGYSVSYAENKITLTASAGTPFSDWAATHITALDPTADSSEAGDPDGDGRSNLVEFALNDDPLSGRSSGKVVGQVAPVDGVLSLVLSLPVRGTPAFSGDTEKVSEVVDSMTYTIQGSASLVDWNLAVSEVLGADKIAIEESLPPLDAGWTYRTFKAPNPVGQSSSDFLRAVIDKK